MMNISVFSVEEIIKQCDQSTGAGFKALESFLRSKNTNNNLSKDETKNNNKEEERLDEIKEMIHLNEEQKNTLKDIIYINTLKNQINTLNEDLNKKEKEINQIKKVKIIQIM